MIIPQENSKEALKQREAIISQVYRTWTEKNPTKQVLQPLIKRQHKNPLPLYYRDYTSCCQNV
jgi:hypothetical protein